MPSPSPGTGDIQDDFWPLPKANFSVDIGDDYLDIPFQEVTGLDISTESIEYRHGNAPNGSINMPSLLSYSDVTLKKGLFTTDNNFFDWIEKIKANTYRRLTVIIKLLNELGEPEFIWTLQNAFPVQVTPTDLNSTGSEAAIETIVFSYENLIIATN